MSKIEQNEWYGSSTKATRCSSTIDPVGRPLKAGEQTCFGWFESTRNRFRLPSGFPVKSRWRGGLWAGDTASIMAPMVRRLGKL
jgi:hypothetical protein